MPDDAATDEPYVPYVHPFENDVERTGRASGTPVHAPYRELHPRIVGDHYRVTYRYEGLTNTMDYLDITVLDESVGIWCTEVAPAPGLPATVVLVEDDDEYFARRGAVIQAALGRDDALGLVRTISMALEDEDDDEEPTP